MKTTREDIQGWLVTAIARSLRVDPDEIETAVPFDRFGMDSVVVVHLTEELSQRIGKKLSPTLMYEHPTIDALSEHLAEIA
jgi:acyl carrier protein